MRAPALFSAFPAGAIGDQRLSGTDRRVLAAVAMHDRMGRNRQGCYAGRDVLADETGYNPANVSSALSKLVELRFLDKEARGTDRRRATFFVRYAGNRFARIPISAISDRRLSDAAFRVLAAVALHDHGRGSGCWASREVLARFTTLTTRAVTLGMADLEALGYIARIRSDVDARRVRTYILAFSEPPISVASGSPNSVASGSPNFPSESCPGGPDQLPTVPLSDRDRLPSAIGLSNETNEITTPIYSLERDRIDFVETRIDAAEAAPENGASSNVSERHPKPTTEGASRTAVGLLRGSQAIPLARAFSKPSHSRTDVDSKIVDAFGEIGVGKADAWIALQALAAPDLDRLRQRCTEEHLTRQVLACVAEAALSPLGPRPIDWSGT